MDADQAQRARRHFIEDRAGDRAAEVAALHRLVNHDGHDDARLPRGRHAHEARHVLVDVLAVFNLVGGAGLAGDRIALDAHAAGRAAREHRAHHHGAHLARHFGTKHLRALRLAVRAAEGEINHVAVARERRVGAHELHQGDGHAVAVGNRRLLNRTPGGRGLQASGDRARKAHFG